MSLGQLEAAARNKAEAAGSERGARNAVDLAARLLEAWVRRRATIRAKALGRMF